MLHALVRYIDLERTIGRSVTRDAGRTLQHVLSERAERPEVRQAERLNPAVVPLDHKQHITIDQQAARPPQLPWALSGCTETREWCPGHRIEYQDTVWSPCASQEPNGAIASTPGDWRKHTVRWAERRQERFGHAVDRSGDGCIRGSGIG
jgi:hypothetical protein